MHREISHTDTAFEQESNLTLYLMTAMLGALMALDLVPGFAAWMGWATPWPREVLGYRFAFVAAIFGGIRVVYSSLSALFEGRIGRGLKRWRSPRSLPSLSRNRLVAKRGRVHRHDRRVPGSVHVFPCPERRPQDCRSLLQRAAGRCATARRCVFTREAQVGDRVVVKPGAKVPVDGTVIDGDRSTPARSPARACRATVARATRCSPAR